MTDTKFIQTTSNTFDPDDYDWGQDEDGIVISDLHPQALESIIFIALENSDPERYKWHWLGRKDVIESKGMVFNVQQVVTDEEDRKAIMAEYPAYTFIFDRATHHHDHPISHIATELNELEMTSRIRGTYIDLFGNGNRAMKYGKNCITLTGRKTAKDYIRYQHPSANTMELDMDVLCDSTTRLGQIDDVCMTHSLYYLSHDEIGRILHTRGSRRIHALIHRHPNSAGSLNRGELVYSVDPITKKVTQVNRSTGEKYEHNSLEGLFHQSTLQTSYGGVTWTIHKAGFDSFIVEFVGCPNRICEPWKPLNTIAKHTSEKVVSKGIKYSSFLNWSWITFCSDKRTVILEDIDLLNKLRRYAAGKPRNSQLFKELMAQGKRYINKLDIISIHGGTFNDVEPAQLVDYVSAGMYMDVEHELETVISHLKFHAKAVSDLNSFYTDGTVPTDLVLATEVADYVSKNTSKVALEMLSAPAIPSRALDAIINGAAKGAMSAKRDLAAAFGQKAEEHTAFSTTVPPDKLRGKNVIFGSW